MIIKKRTGPRSVIRHLGLPQSPIFKRKRKNKYKVHSGYKIPSSYRGYGGRLDTIPFRKYEEHKANFYRTSPNAPKWNTINMREMTNFISSRQPPPNFNRAPLNLTSAELNRSANIVRDAYVNQLAEDLTNLGPLRQEIRNTTRRKRVSQDNLDTYMNIANLAGDFQSNREWTATKKEMDKYWNQIQRLDNRIRRDKEKVEKIEGRLSMKGQAPFPTETQFKNYVEEYAEALNVRSPFNDSNRASIM